MDQKQIKQVVSQYLKDLSNKIKIDKAILFGSALTGKISIDSDIDLMILSRNFQQMDDADRLDLLNASRIQADTQNTPMDIFGMTPEEYDQASPLSIVGEIKETGREVYLSIV